MPGQGDSDSGRDGQQEELGAEDAAGKQQEAGGDVDAAGTDNVSKASDDDVPGSGMGEFESLFAKELKRRGISEAATAAEAEKQLEASRVIDSKRQKIVRPAAPGTEEQQRQTVLQELDGQLERSRQLQSEGLEGLPQRAGSLLTLGSTLFLRFLPAGAFIVGATSLLYLFFGSEFVHFGPYEGMDMPASQPEYIDPYELLASEPNYDGL